MGSFEIINSHSFNSLINHISDFQISLSNKIKQIEIVLKHPTIYLLIKFWAFWQEKNNKRSKDKYRKSMNFKQWIVKKIQLLNLITLINRLHLLVLIKF
jgi:hypothetical protein